MSKDKRYESAILDAHNMGEEAGRNAADWCYDGNTDDNWFVLVLKGLDDGDPAVYDRFRVPNLSGEYAGDPTPATLADSLDLDYDSDDDRTILDDACEHYLTAASDAFFIELERTCHAHLDA